jgi:ATP-binding cassette, subfamily B, multidrug efflux pump
MFSIFKKLSWFFIENWKRYTVAIVLLTIVGILDVIPPKLVGNAIDDIHLGAMTWDIVGKYLWLIAGIALISYGMT